MAKAANPVTKSNDRWQAESDFRSLAEAEQIRSDKARLVKAKTAGKRLVREEQKALSVKQRIVRKK